MSPTVPVYEAARAARRILETIRRGDLAGVEAELERSAHGLGTGALPPGEAERMELLDAVAEDMRLMLGRMPRGSPERFERAEVDLRLLRHLAGENTEAANTSSQENGRARRWRRPGAAEDQEGPAANERASTPIKPRRRCGRLPGLRQR